MHESVLKGVVTPMTGAPTLAFVHGYATVKCITQAQAGCCLKVENWMTTFGLEGMGKKCIVRGQNAASFDYLHLHDTAITI